MLHFSILYFKILIQTGFSLTLHWEGTLTQIHLTQTCRSWGENFGEITLFCYHKLPHVPTLSLKLLPLFSQNQNHNNVRVFFPSSWLEKQYIPFPCIAKCVGFRFLWVFCFVLFCFVFCHEAHLQLE